MNRRQVRREMALLRAEVRQAFDAFEENLIDWMSTLWLGQVVVTIGLILAARAIWG